MLNFYYEDQFHESDESHLRLFLVLGAGGLRNLLTRSSSVKTGSFGLVTGEGVGLS